MQARLKLTELFISEIPTSQENARADAKRAASERVGVIVETVSEMKNGNLTRDEIRTISAVILKIHSESMTVEI